MELLYLLKMDDASGFYVSTRGNARDKMPDKEF